MPSTRQQILLSVVPARLTLARLHSNPTSPAKSPGQSCCSFFQAAGRGGTSCLNPGVSHRGGTASLLDPGAQLGDACTGPVPSSQEGPLVKAARARGRKLWKTNMSSKQQSMQSHFWLLVPFFFGHHKMINHRFSQSPFCA